MHPDTIAIHAARDGLGEAHVPPIDLSTTYKTPNLPEATKSIDAMAAGGLPTGSSVYQRLFNPTVDRFERALATLEGADAAVSISVVNTDIILPMPGGGRNSFLLDFNILYYI